jgi:hypothetical protein
MCDGGGCCLWPSLLLHFLPPSFDFVSASVSGCVSVSMSASVCVGVSDLACACRVLPLRRALCSVLASALVVCLPACLSLCRSVSPPLLHTRTPSRVLGLVTSACLPACLSVSQSSIDSHTHTHTHTRTRTRTHTHTHQRARTNTHRRTHQTCQSRACVQGRTIPPSRLGARCSFEMRWAHACAATHVTWILIPAQASLPYDARTQAHPLPPLAMLALGRACWLRVF